MALATVAAIVLAPHRSRNARSARYPVRVARFGHPSSMATPPSHPPADNALMHLPAPRARARRFCDAMRLSYSSVAAEKPLTSPHGGDAPVPDTPPRAERPDDAPPHPGQNRRKAARRQGPRKLFASPRTSMSENSSPRGFRFLPCSRAGLRHRPGHGERQRGAHEPRRHIMGNRAVITTREHEIGVYLH